MKIELEKAQLRKKYLSVTKSEQQVSCSDIDLNNVEILLAYLPLKTEVDVNNIIEKAMKQNVTVAVPSEDPRYFCVLDSCWQQKILTLRNKTKTIHTDKKIDLTLITKKTVILVPGLAFTEDGLRLGRGSGFYDRVLAFTENNPNVTSIGICKKNQLAENLPANDNDKRVLKVLFH